MADGEYCSTVDYYATNLIKIAACTKENASVSVTELPPEFACFSDMFGVRIGH